MRRPVGFIHYSNRPKTSAGPAVDLRLIVYNTIQYMKNLYSAAIQKMSRGADNTKNI